MLSLQRLEKLQNYGTALKPHQRRIRQKGKKKERSNSLKGKTFALKHFRGKVFC
jgi:hypothetical protein